MPLPRVSVSDRRLVTPDDRSVVLRGAVTLTGDHRGPVDMGPARFDQLASWGATVQQIRLEGARLGVLGTTRDPAYLDKLDDWVTMAAARGIWSIFKMTTYDVPEIGGLGGAFKLDNWQRFWDRDEWRADRIEAWRAVWSRFTGRADVIGYDVLNEPTVGTDTPTLAADNLYPFFDDCSAALRTIDAEALLLIQPPTGPPVRQGVLGGTTPHGPQRIGPAGCVYAPHFYPDITQDVGPAGYDHEMDGFHEEAAIVAAPMLIGEYGLPTTPLLPVFRTWNAADERAKIDLFDRNGLGAIRPWFIDAGPWNLCGDGWVETARSRMVARPFVARHPRASASWTWDASSLSLAVTLPDGAAGEVELAGPGEWIANAHAKGTDGGVTVEATGANRASIAVPTGAVELMIGA